MLKSKKIIASILLAVYFLVGVSVPYANAGQAGPWYMQRLDQWYDKVYDDTNKTEIFGERYTAAQVQWIMYGLIAFFVNTATNGNTEAGKCILDSFLRTGPISISTCLTAISDTVSYNTSTPSSALAYQPEKKSVLAQFFADRPLSGITYVKDLGRKFNFIQDAQAQDVQGFGYVALRPIQDLWRAARDVSFALLIFAAIAIAFMVMFRVKLSPQVVVTAQSAIPKLLIAIVLIQFSYAIAGLMVDLMYVVLALFGLVMNPSDPGGQFSRMVAGPTERGLLVDFITYVIAFFATFILAVIEGVFDAALGGDYQAFVSTNITGFLGIIFIVILFILVLVVWFRTIFLLFKTLAMIIIKTMVFPFYIIAGVIVPGVGVWAWIRSFAADLAVFVVASILLNLSFRFLAESFQASVRMLGTFPPGPLLNIINSLAASSGGLIPVQQTGAGNWPPLLGRSIEGNVLFLGVSLVLLFMIPKAGEMIHATLSRRPFAVGTAIGEAFGPVTGPAQFGWGAAQKPLQETARDIGGGLITRASSSFNRGGGGTTTKPKAPFTS